MAPKKKKETSLQSDSDGIFSGMFVFFVDAAVQARRLQIWKQRLEQMGAKIEGHLSKRVTHIFAMNWDVLKRKVDSERLSTFKGKILVYQWLEESLKLGEKVSEDFYLLKEEPDLKCSHQSLGEVSDHANKSSSVSEDAPHQKKLRSSPQHLVDSTITLPGHSRTLSAEDKRTATSEELCDESFTLKSDDGFSNTLDPQPVNYDVAGSPEKRVGLYNPPDLNKNITEIFKKLKDIYRALGDDRRSYSYSKAISVIEKLAFRIETSDQVKDLPDIGKSLSDHVQEIVLTGKLSKLEYFENDEKVKTIALFGDVWGIGPATAQKLYDKGHRTLEDLKGDPSLTASQKLGLQYFDDIKTRIPRHEVAEMEAMLQKVGEEILPGVVIVCGGSYRRGLSSCGDMDIIITHPDGKSHKGFLAKFEKRLKDMNFLRGENLTFSTHSEKDSDSGIDTYMGLCTYPGQELRRRIDIKVYPKSIYPFGLIHWTGNDTLNRRLRTQASKKGYRLDDTGLFLATPSSGGTKGSRGMATLHFDTEKEVFDFLEFPCLEPHERNL